MNQSSPKHKLTAMVVGMLFGLALLYFAGVKDAAELVGGTVLAGVVVGAIFILLDYAVTVLPRLIEKPERLKGATELVTRLHVKRVYPRRRIHSGYEGALEDINQALLGQRGPGHKRIIMCGVSLRDFFQESRGGDFVPEFLSLLEHSNTELVAAVLHPRCREADRRANIEKLGKTRTDIEATIEILEAQIKQHGIAGRLALAAYKQRPSLFAVITEEEAFVQRYVSFPPVDRRDIFEAGIGGCCGDLEHVVRYAKESDQYDIVWSEVVCMMATECDWVVGHCPPWIDSYRLRLEQTGLIDGTRPSPAILGSAPFDDS